MRTIQLPRISLIVCSRNRPDMLVESVKSILRGRVLPDELIVVDQSDEPNHDLAAMAGLAGCEIRYHWSRTVGLSRANNVGVALARHDVLAFAHDDVSATPDWLGALVGALVAAGRRAVVTGRVLPTAQQVPGGFAPSTKRDLTPAIYQGRIGKDVLFPMNMAMHRSAVSEVGGFDERLGPGTPFPAAEDNDFGFRLLEAGYRICYVPEATLYHHAWRTADDYLPLRWSYGRGQGAYYAKHLSLRDRYMLWRMAGSLRSHMVQSIWLARRQRQKAYGSAVYVLGLLSGAAQWLITQTGQGAAGPPQNPHPFPGNEDDDMTPKGIHIAKAELPATSMIICSRNRPRLLLESVESVLAGDQVPAELLIMDQSDEPHPVLANFAAERGCDVRYVRTDVVGECPAKNLAMRMARYEILVFTDDDVLVTPGWLGALVGALAAGGRRAVVTGQVLPTEAETPGGFAPTKKVDLNPAVYQGRVGEDVLFPMNMAMYRSALEEVGDFDERLGAGGPFLGAEDNDLGFRLLEAGYRICYVPEAALYHRAWRAARDYVPVRWAYGYCQGAFYAKHLSLRDRYILRRMAWDLARHVGRLPRRLLRLEPQWLQRDLAYIFGMLTGATKWMLTQRILPRAA